MVPVGSLLLGRLKIASGPIMSEDLRVFLAGQARITHSPGNLLFRHRFHPVRTHVLPEFIEHRNLFPPPNRKPLGPYHIRWTAPDLYACRMGKNGADGSRMFGLRHSDRIAHRSWCFCPARFANESHNGNFIFRMSALVDRRYRATPDINPISLYQLHPAHLVSVPGRSGQTGHRRVGRAVGEAHLGTVPPRIRRAFLRRASAWTALSRRCAPIPPSNRLLVILSP